MPGLPATGTLSYNGYVFDGATHASVDVTFVKDESRRIVIAHRHVITVQAIVSGSDGILPDLDRTVENIRRRLGESGKPLVFINKGFGVDLVINTGVVYDIDGGPHPEVLEWVSIGDDKAAQIVWRVTVTIPICEPGRTIRSRGVLSMNYGIDWTIDQHGNTTRQLRGHLMIVMRRPGLDTADNYRDFFSPAVIAGFARTQNWSIDITKRRLDFSIIDTEIPSPNPYPAGITAISGTHRLGWRMGNQAGHWNNRISCTIQPEARLSGAQAWQVFLTIAAQRTMFARQQANRDPFLLSLEIEEDLFGRPQTFQAEYRLLGSLRDFVGVSGLWRPLGTDWQTWAVSMAEATYSNRGNARLLDIAGNDAIINLCGPAIPLSPNNLRARTQQTTPEFTQSTGSEAERTQFLNARPKAGTSWINFDNVLSVFKKSPVAQQQIVQTPATDNGGWNVAGAAPSSPPIFDDGSDSKLNDAIQQGGKGSYGVRMIGAGRRAGHQIPRPRLDRIGTRKAREIRSKYSARRFAKCFGVDVFDGWWIIDYVLDGTPGPAPPLRNLEQDLLRELGVR